MSKELTSRDKTAIEQVSAAPSWLVKAAENDTSKDSLKEHLILPKLCVVPSQPGERMKKYKEEFGEGALVVVPGGIGVVPHDTWVKVVPLFMFTEFRKWADMDDKESNRILGRTYDPNDEIARKARNEDKRNEPYGDLTRKVKGKVQPFEYQYMEHLCFTVLIYSGENRGIPAVLEFQRGSFWKGKEFSTAAMMRQVDGVECPLWTQVWEICGTEVSAKGFTWWAVEFRNPEDGNTLITDEEAAAFEKRFKTHKQSYVAKTLTVDLSESDEGEERATEAVVIDDGEM